jgi:hypothetical protein
MNPPQRPDDHPAPVTDGGAFKTDIVNNIPLHQAAPAAGHEDHELDKIMRDVGHQLNKEDHKPAKKHHLFGKHQPKSEPKLVAQPVDRHQVVNMDVLPATTQSHQAPKPAANAPQQPSAAKPHPAPKDKRSAPVMVILLTIIVTGILIAAAVSAYK